MKRFGALSLLCLALAGCNTVSEGEFNTAKALLDSPAVKQKAINECVADERRSPAADRRELAAIMNVSVERQPQIFCQRVFNGMASGKLTYEDYRKLRNSSADNSKMVKLLQGR